MRGRQICRSLMIFVILAYISGAFCVYLVGLRLPAVCIRIPHKTTFLPNKTKFSTFQKTGDVV